MEDDDLTHGVVGGDNCLQSGQPGTHSSQLRGRLAFLAESLRLTCQSFDFDKQLKPRGDWVVRSVTSHTNSCCLVWSLERRVDARRSSLRLPLGRRVVDQVWSGRCVNLSLLHSMDQLVLQKAVASAAPGRVPARG